MLVVRAKPQLDQGARIGRCLRLPTMVGLVLLHGLLRSIVPLSGRLPIEIMFANQSFLDGAGALWIDVLLTPV